MLKIVRSDILVIVMKKVEVNCNPHFLAELRKLCRGKENEEIIIIYDEYTGYYKVVRGENVETAKQELQKAIFLSQTG